MKEVFRAFTDLFLLDIIENNVIFALYSTLGSTLEISLKQVDKDYIMKRPTMFENLDWFTTNFKAYTLVITKISNREIAEIPVYTSLWDRVIEKTNNLEYETQGQVKTYKDYIEDLKKQFPNESSRTLNKIIRYGLIQLRSMVNLKIDTYLYGNTHTFKVVFGGWSKLRGWYRLLDKRAIARHDELDGWYYFGIPTSKFEELDYLPKKSINFGKVVLRSSLFPITSRKFTYVFAVPLFEDIGNFYVKEDFITKHAILIGQRSGGTYNFVDNGWKQKDSRWRRERTRAKRKTNCHKNWWEWEDIRHR